MAQHCRQLYSAEINAMVMAVEDLTETMGTRLTGRDIHIYSDSQGLLQHIRSLINTGKRVNSQTQDLVVQLAELSRLQP